MNNRNGLGKALLWAHLFVCLVWLFRTTHEPAGWMVHVLIWSILAVQFTWGFTVGLIVGPNRNRRGSLWWSLLTVFMPLYFIGPICMGLALSIGLPLALVYFAIFVMILACETWGGVMLGARLHTQDGGDWT